MILNLIPELIEIHNNYPKIHTITTQQGLHHAPRGGDYSHMVVAAIEIVTKQLMLSRI